MVVPCKNDKGRQACGCRFSSDKACRSVVYFYGCFFKLRIKLQTKLCRFRQGFVVSDKRFVVSDKALSFPTSALSENRELRYCIILLTSFFGPSSQGEHIWHPCLQSHDDRDYRYCNTYIRQQSKRIRFALSRIDDTPSTYKKHLRHFESVDYLSLVQILREVVLFLHKEIGLRVDRLATRDRAAGARRRKYLSCADQSKGEFANGNCAENVCNGYWVPSTS